ncbi:MAG TPA: NepR family anti-sigma factor [Sphingomicrobium sp.]
MSAKVRGHPEGGRQAGRSARPGDREKKGRKQRSSDLGRALRSVYDDTLRETVPDEFLSLLGKLS